MSGTDAFLQDGLMAFSALLEQEYGQPLTAWAQMSTWSDAESLQISRALAVLMKQPIASMNELSAGDSAASETQARRTWMVSDAKIAGSAFAASWQYRLLADIENSREKQPGQMATPADPARFALFIGYQGGFFAALADHLLRLLCDRAKLPAFTDGSPLAPGQSITADAILTADLLRQVPGLEQAGGDFIAGLVFLISKIGARGFGDWCDERSTAQSDDKM